MCAAEQSALSRLPESLLCTRHKAGCAVFSFGYIKKQMPFLRLASAFLLQKLRFLFWQFAHIDGIPIDLFRILQRLCQQRFRLWGVLLLYADVDDR